MIRDIEKYADLIIKKAINVQKGQVLVISAPIESVDFTKILVKKAYVVGAKEVLVEWYDDELTRLNFHYKTAEDFLVVEQHVIDKYQTLDMKGAAYLKLSATDPQNLAGIDNVKIANASMARNQYLKAHSDRLMADELRWSIFSIPTKKWAKKVFPNEENSYELLWTEILKAVYADSNDPLKRWDQHIAELKKRYQYLNEQNFKKLIFTNKLGTKLEVGLVKGHIWTGGNSFDKNNISFIANVPTQEVYTMPDCNLVNGIVFASKPLSYQGNLIEEFYLQFTDGVVTGYGAIKGQDVLQSILASDEGAKRIGEVALVNDDSPISQSGVLFYNTLFDENASCHLALGEAYPTTISNYADILPSERHKVGINESSIHIDFMFGTADLKIDAIDQDGLKTTIFRSGNFCI